MQEILLLNSVLLLPDHRLAILPNGKTRASGVATCSRQRRVATIGLTVAYGEDLAAEDRGILDGNAIAVVIEELGESGV